MTLVVGCGGVIGDPLGDGGGTDGTTGNDAQPGSDAGPSCTKLLADLETARLAAIQCCPTCNIVQCVTQIDGLCCPVTVTSADTDASKAYEKALAAVKNAGCMVNCPAIACSTQPSNDCQNDGTCRQ